MSYVVCEKNNVQVSYVVTSSCGNPRIAVESNGAVGYIPLVMGSISDPMIKVSQVGGYETLRAGVYSSTTRKSTDTRVASSYVGASGTSSSSGSTLQTTIEASTAMSFTSTAAETRSSTSGYNGLSNAQAQTCSSTNSWAGSSTRRDDYQTEVANSYGLTNATALTRSSTSGWDYPKAYQITRTWYNTLNRTTGYSGYSYSYYTVNTTHCITVYMETEDGYRRYLNSANQRVTLNWGYRDYRCTYSIYDADYRWAPAINGYVVQRVYGGSLANTWTPGADRGWYEVTAEWADGYSAIWNLLDDPSSSNESAYHYASKRQADPVYYTAGNTAGMQAETTALTEDYIDYGNPQYDYDWVVINTVALTCSSTYGYRGITSSASYYQTTLANNVGLSSVTALTRSSTSAYSGVSHRRSDYTGTQVNSVGMTNATALTRESVYGYSGITTRPEEYASSSVDVGNLSYTTALLEPAYRTNTVTTAYSGVSYEYSTYAHSFVYGYFQYNSDGQYNYTVNRVDAASYEIYDTHGDRIARNNSYQGGWMPAYVDFRRNVGGQLVDGIMDINIPDATNTARNIFYSYDVISATGTGGPSGGGNTYTFRKEFRERTNTVSYTSTNTIGMDSVTELTGTVLGDIDHYNTTGYSGISSSQSNYAVVRNSPTGLSNVTTLTQSSTSGYSGQLSRTSSYETLIPNDGANALAAQALTCSSTSKYRGISSTSASMSSTEMRTSYYTSVYSESTTRSYTAATITTFSSTRETTVSSESLISGNGYKVVHGVIVVDANCYSTYEVSSYTNTQYTSSTWVAISETVSTARTSTYTRTSGAIKSYGANTSLSTYVSTYTYIHTYSDYV